MKDGIRIMIADDHLVFRMGLRSLLASEDDLSVIGEARNGDECIAMYRALAPDVLLMDLRMPGTNGLEALAAIRRADPTAKVLFLTSYCTEEDVYQAMQLGAMGYVLKDIERQDLMDAIRTVSRDQKCVPEAVASRLAERMPRPALTRRETEILKLVVKGLINREIADILGVSVSTVKNQLNTLFAKLDVTDRTEAATAALQRGIVQLDD